MLGLPDMKEPTEILGDLVKPEAHDSVFIFALQFAFWYRSLTNEKRKE